MPRLNYNDLIPILKFIYQNFQNTRFTFSEIPPNLKFTGIASGLQAKDLIIRAGVITFPHRIVVWKLTPKGIRFAERISPSVVISEQGAGVQLSPRFGGESD